MPVSSWAEGLRVLLVLSDNSSPYQTLAKELKQNLSNQIQLTEFKSPSELSGQLPQFDLVIAIGMKAMESTIAHNAPALLGAMIPSWSYESLRMQRSTDTSAIYLNQPYDRQLDFIQAALPDIGKIGVLYSPAMDTAITELKLGIVDRGMSISGLPVESADAVYRVLDAALDKVDVLLAVPDSTVYNNSSVRNILLTSYRHKVPLIGISQAYVKAGALCAIFSTPEQLAEQTAEVVMLFDKTRRLPSPQYPISFSIAFNQEVARSLGVLPISPEVIRERMHKIRKGGK